MKKISLSLTALALLSSGCISPKWERLIPENKDASIHVVVGGFYPAQVDIETRVDPKGKNPLPPLTNSVTRIRK